MYKIIIDPNSSTPDNPMYKLISTNQKKNLYLLKNN